MDSAATTQRELFSKFMIAYNRVQRETVKVDRSIPSPGKLNEREELKKRPTMTGRARMVRGVVEEQLSEVEGILDHVDCLIDNLDEAGDLTQRLADAEPVEGAVEVDVEEIFA